MVESSMIVLQGVAGQRGNGGLERYELLLVDEVKLEHKEHEVLEGRVQMPLDTEILHVLVVRVVKMCVHSKHALENVFHGRHKLLREFGCTERKMQKDGTTRCECVCENKVIIIYTRTWICGEYLIVVDQHGDPVHQTGDVVRCTELCGPLVLSAIHPQVLEFLASRHDGTHVARAEL